MAFKAFPCFIFFHESHAKDCTVKIGDFGLSRAIKGEAAKLRSSFHDKTRTATRGF